MSLTHQELGNKLKLFFIDESSPGSIFWLPHGTLVFNRLVDYIKYYYQLKGYQEVVTPNIYDKSLWKTSGHWDKYRENMFIIRQDRYIEGGDNDKNDIEEKIDNDELEGKKLFSLKPMNCGGHCLVFNKMRPSYKDLPVRLAEFGVLHRNEATGSLNGLFRVRRFQQDDSHIFCGMEHLKPEILEILKFIDHTYNLFGIKYKIYLSTRPEKYIGKKEVWDQAETILKECICEMTGKGEKKINIKEGDGAFYGPKIDIALLDKKKRENQCGTVQLDFNLPSEERFNLKYTNAKMEQVNPIIIHRAILGSLERFIGILLEHTQGKLPLWLSPRQIGITSVNKEFNEYASHIKVKIKEALPQVIVDFNDDTTEDLRNQIKSFEKMKYNIILTVGKDEVEGNTVTVRLGKNRTTMGLADFIEKVKDMLEEYKL
jgi:threonyl-tRNA synthetase